MGQSQLLAAGTAALSLVAAALAQGPDYRERWSDLHLELLRERVLRESQGRDQATLQAVADLLAATDGSAPFQPAARALARLRGKAADVAFLLRASMGAFVLPEVVDPKAGREDCRDLHVTMQLPYVMPLADAIEIELEVFDMAGVRVHLTRFGKGATVEDLRMAHTSTTVPAADLADGAYRVRVGMVLDEAPPRAGDPVLEHAFHVLRGYEARAASLRDRSVLIAARLPLEQRAVVGGMLAEVERAFTGEAFAGQSDAVADLERAERAFANVAADRVPLDGIVGLCPLGLPTGGESFLGAVVDLPVGAAEGAARQPLVVVIGAAPALDVLGHRPMEPMVRSARWLQRRVGDLGLGDAARVAWLQSPGGGMPFVQALPAALAALRDLVPSDGRTVLVLELDAAIALCCAPDVLRREATAVVLVGAGALSLPALRGLGDLPILGVPLSGHRSGQSLLFTAALARGEHGEVDWPCRFTLVPDAPRPWVFGAAAARSEINAFVRSLPAAK